MQTILASGHLITPIDLLALEYYLLETPCEWAEAALNGMIAKAKDNIMKDYFELWRSQQAGNIIMDYSVIIPALIAMNEFTPYNIQTPPLPTINRTEERTVLTCENGYSVEDWQKNALDAYFEDPEDDLTWLLENKISKRRQKCLIETRPIYIQPAESFPAEEDAYITYVTNKVDYKDRAERVAEDPLA